MKIREIYILAKNLTKSDNRFLNLANIIALLSVVIGNIALLLSLSILNGFDEKLRETAIQFTSDISVQTLNGSEMEDAADIKRKILTVKSVTQAVPTLQTEGIVTSPQYTEGISIQSINPNNDIKNFKKNIVKGSFRFSSDTVKEIFIGQPLAQKLNVKIGDKLMIYALKNQDHISFSSATYSQFKIKAIYNTGMGQYDNSVVFCPYQTLANFLDRSSNSATNFEVYIDNLDKAEEIAKQIDLALGFPYISFTFYTLNRSIFAWIELQKEPIPIVLTIISLVAALNIITMLIITVVEKSHSIGILRALGLESNKIILMFVMLSLRIALIGSIIGITLSLIFAFLQTQFSLISLDSKIYFIDSLPISMKPIFIFSVLGLTFLFSLIASLIPSRIAVKVSPIKAIKFK